jgi:chromosome partitioning protein
VSAVVTFFNNKGGVGKTTLTYHLAWMLRELGANVLAVDLDPQANLTSAFLGDDRVEALWRDNGRRTIYGAMAPLLEGEGGLAEPHVEEIEPGLALVPGDLALSGAEQELAAAWPDAMDGKVRAFRVLTAFAAVADQARGTVDADVVLVDVGPNLGAINRAALVASDHVIVPVAPDLYSLQGLRNLGPTLRSWRKQWADRRAHNPKGDLWLPTGEMKPAGYVVLQHAVRADRVVGAYDRWLRKVPEEYVRSVLGEAEPVSLPRVEDDPNCLGLIKHYQSLVPMAQEARKPVFLLRSADGAIGGHIYSVRAAYEHFADLTRQVCQYVGVDLPESPITSITRA